MRFTSMTVLCLCVIAATAPVDAQKSVCASTENRTMTDSAVVELESAWAAAAVAHDTATLRCVLADNFVDTNWQGVLRTRRDVLTTGPVTPSGLTQHFSDWHIARHDDTMIVRGLNMITGADNKTVSALRFTDVLQYLDGRWQAVAAQETMVRQASR